MKITTPVLIILFTFLLLNYIPSHQQSAAPRFVRTGMPTIIKDRNLKVELVSEGLQLPTSMAFLGPDDILVLEKEKDAV